MPGCGGLEIIYSVGEQAVTLHGSVITRPGLTNEPDKTWEIDSLSVDLYSVQCRAGPDDNPGHSEPHHI